MLKKEMEQLGYQLVDLHEHEFQKNDIKIGIAYMEDLQPFADIDYKHLKKEEVEGVTYKTLTVRDYLKVYNQSILDGYRRTKNNHKDQKKLNILYSLLD